MTNPDEILMKFLKIFPNFQIFVNKMAEDGEKLSKNELKRRMKAEKKAAEKAEKAKEAPSTGPKKDSAKISEEEISPNEYLKLRGAAVEELKKGLSHPYPHKYDVTVSLTEFIAKYGDLEDGSIKEDVTVRVAGRIHAIRESGAKLVFYDLRGEANKIQVYVIK